MHNSANPLIFAAALAAFVAYQYWRQAVLMRGLRWVRKEEKPTTFWTVIAGQALIAIVMGGFWVHELLQRQP